MVNFALPGIRIRIAMIVNRLRFACVLIYVWCMASPAHAQSGAIIWDTRAAAEYRQGHIPGTINIGDANVMLRNPNTEDIMPLGRIEQILGAAGIGAMQNRIEALEKELAAARAQKPAP